MNLRDAVVLVALLLAASSTSAAQQVIPLVDPDGRAELVFDMPYAEIEIVGTERPEISVDLQTLDGKTGTVFVPAVAHGNRVELLHPLNAVSVRALIQVPRRTDLEVRTSNTRYVRITGVHGELEIETSNGSLEIVDAAGGIVANTSNGPITATLTELPPDATISLLTSNAPIRLTLPEDFEGQVLAETDTGAITSDFSVVPQPPVGIRRPGRVLSGLVGSGRASVRLRTDNAGIELLRPIPEVP